MILKTEKDKKTLIKVIQDLDLKTAYSVTWKKYFPNRTLDQNKYYWLVIACISTETGNNKDELHEVFLIKFAPKKEVNLEEFMLLPKRSTEMDTKEFTVYLNSIILWAGEFLKIEIPNPDDLHFEEFKEHYSNFL